MGGNFTQFFPPSPTFTEKNVPSLVGKVFIVTGGNAGIGLELVKILYAKGGTVYIAARSPSKIAAEIEAIKSTHAGSPPPGGQLKSLHLDLSDLTTVPTCASTFLAQESRLDVLWNNAGISQAPVGSTSIQGHEAHIGTNCLGPFLLTKLLLPVLRRTAASASAPASISPSPSPTNAASVRVVFTSSGIIDLMTGPRGGGGLSLAELRPGHFSQDKNSAYLASKVGNWFLASEFDRRFGRADGVVYLTQNPGTLKTKGFDNVHWFVRFLMSSLMHEPKMGAYTELWAGLSDEVTGGDGGRYAVPWGRWHPDPRRDVERGLKGKEEGGTELAAEFWEWCEGQTGGYGLDGK